CPCGYHTDPNRTCTCSIPNIQRYMAKISGPLLDRIDIHLDVPTVKYKELASNRMGEPSKNIRERVERARKRQQHRFTESPHTYCNARMESREIRRTCRLDSASEELMRTAINSYGLSARAYDRILKVARTIADLDESSDIKSDHISEAIQYRTLDRSLIT
ncbi:magnesium chelatase, partial [candidate division KSB1 bacterium]|nr:magnesium chelatase [candidate division KSB1 bacterium]